MMYYKGTKNSKVTIKSIEIIGIKSASNIASLNCASCPTVNLYLLYLLGVHNGSVRLGLM